MAISAMIDTKHDYGDGGYYIEDIGYNPRGWVMDAIACGGVWLEPHNGTTPFIPWAEIESIWFDDGTGDQVEVPQPAQLVH